MKRKLFQLLQLAALGGAATILGQPAAVTSLVPINQQAKVAAILAIAGAFLPSILPQAAKTALWSSVPPSDTPPNKLPR